MNHPQHPESPATVNRSAPRGRVPVIGLLGAPGSGKSHYSRVFADHGAVVIDADALAREALTLPEVSKALVQRWGSGVLNGAGQIDRKAVGGLVFNNPEELAALETIVHPRVNAQRRQLREQWQDTPGVVAIIEDCPLLLERGLEADCDILAFIDTPREVRLQRVIATRGWDEAELNRREKNQWPLDTKRRRADYILPGDADDSLIHDRVHSLLEKVQASGPPLDPARPSADG